MKKLLLVLGMSMLLGACSTTRDGVSLGLSTGPDATEVAKARSEMEQNAASSTAKGQLNDALSKNSKAGLIMIGEVGPLRTYDAQDAAKNYEKTYLKSATEWHPGHPTPFMTEADYVNTVAGWTTVEIYSIPGIVSLRMPAQVSKAVVSEVAFPSTVASYFVQKTGDLVVSESNDDGWMFVTKVLCKDSFAQDGGKSYRICAADYVRGRFDANSGKELDSKLAVKKDGATIDPATYKRIGTESTASK